MKKRQLSKPKEKIVQKGLGLGPELPTDGLKESERKVLRALNELGFTEVFHRGWPDFSILDEGTIKFVEVKSSPRDKPKPQQEEVHEALRNKGFTVVVIDGNRHRLLVKSDLKARLLGNTCIEKGEYTEIEVVENK